MQRGGVKAKHDLQSFHYRNELVKSNESNTMTIYRESSLLQILMFERKCLQQSINMSKLTGPLHLLETKSTPISYW